MLRITATELARKFKKMMNQVLSSSLDSSTIDFIYEQVLPPSQKHNGCSARYWLHGISRDSVH